MNSSILEISIILVLLVANGIFAMTEIAIVSSRKALLQSMADKGNKGASKALILSESPNRFLSTVQIGITLVGIVAGALGSGSVADRLAEFIAPMPFIGQYSGQLSLLIVISILTYLSLVVGELVPKRLAMKFPETIASGMAGPMAAISTISSPAVSLLSWSTGAILKLFGIREGGEEGMSREELTVLVRQGVITGSINRSESRMMEGVIGFEKLVTYDLMIPRTRIVWIEQGSNHEEIWPVVMASTQGVFPVYDDRRDNLVGVVSIKDIYGRLAAGETVDFGKIMQKPLFVPEMQKASVLLETFRATGQRAAFVLDEFGSVMGMVTLIDVMEAIVGDVPSREEQLASPILQRADGTWLIDGLFEIEKLPEHLADFTLPEGGGDEYQTLSGWFMKELARMPAELDRISAGDWTFEVIDMDGTRVDKILATFRAGQPDR
ncbi:HlyC/CorC family transporter [Luteolibacter yonseiensis]|uniref:HlyC/CorC family transporter n=1 Tax=Luteolibacter yonseiensis TaxID=1144680 RepID=A0A934R6J6_9BACT|nr:hemolysin family protein [Luteolibacter yonseiensis]MBK1817889.1 HlyC/CorC family transporter [Luteolibacter yonseiensis]